MSRKYHFKARVGGASGRGEPQQTGSGGGFSRGLRPDMHIPIEKQQSGSQAFKAAEQRLEGDRKMALQSPYLRRNYETTRKNFIQFLEKTILERFSRYDRQPSEEENRLRGKLQKLQLEIEQEKQEAEKRRNIKLIENSKRKKPGNRTKNNQS